MSSVHLSSPPQVSGLSPHPTDDVLVRVENVSKKFCRDLKKSLWYGMKDLGGELLGRSRIRDELRPEEFWAVRDINFELKRGECLGLIGRNGAGKTTLLRMLNGLIKPDIGRIEMRGRVGALIALGAGFNPILTGRENIYVNAAVLGLSKRETDEKFDEIVDFAELGEFIDAPVQSYSSGMQVRLGFAVATALQPDVLLLDEVLSVGDYNFQIKCFNRLGVLMESGVATIIVTHQVNNLERLAQKGIVLSNGQLKQETSIFKAIKYYHAMLCDSSSPMKIVYPINPIIKITKIYEDKILNSDRKMIKIFYKLLCNYHDICHVSYVFRSNGSEVFRSTTMKDGYPAFDINNKSELTIQFDKWIFLLPGLKVSFSIWNRDFREILVWIKDFEFQTTVEVISAINFS